MTQDFIRKITEEQKRRVRKIKKVTEENKKDLTKAGTDETDIELPAEQNNEISGLTSFASGIVSGGN